MEFDRTFIKIRQRNIFEISDIALKVFKKFFLGVFAVGSICIVPFAILNFAVFYPLLDTEFEDRSVIHWWLMTCVVVIQAPIATAAVSQLLGTALFEGDIRIWNSLRHTAKHAFRLIWIYLTRRALGWTFVLGWLIWSDTGLENSLAVLATLLVLCIELLVRSTRPYPNEIILLEQAPFRTQSGDPRINYKTRSNNLHKPAGSMLFGRGLAISMVSIMICFAFYMLFLNKAIFDNQWQSNRWFLIVLYPAALWFAAIYMAIVRFLAYIDLRTRQEGWDIELRIKAEANRLSAKMALGEKEHAGGLL